MTELLLTHEMHVACLAHDIDQRLAARKLLRPYRIRAARKGVETKRSKAA